MKIGKTIGNKCTSIDGEGKYISKEEEKHLIIRAKRGDIDAKNELFKKLDNFVRHIVFEHCKNKEYNPEYFDNLVRAGYAGLISAYEKYDLLSKNRLTTYAYRFVWKAIDIEKWIRRGLPEDLAKSASAVFAAKIRFEKENLADSEVKILSKETRISIEKVQEILDYLKTKFVPIERENENGSFYEHLSTNGIVESNEEKEESLSTEKRVWEFQEEDIGFINPKIADYLKSRWKENDKKRYGKFSSAVNSNTRCLRRRLIYSNGSRGVIDSTMLEELHKIASGWEVYDRRSLWKAYC